MRSEQERKARLATAESIYNAVKDLNGLDQSDKFRELLNGIDDDKARSAVEMLVWYWIGHGIPTSDAAPKQWLTSNVILGITFVALFLICWVELGLSLIWSGALAFAAVAFLSIVFRLFDRGFIFRRLFIACISAGLFLITPVSLHFSFETPLGPISLGGAPDGALVMIWVICTLLTFSVAVWEHVVSKRT